MVNSASYTIRPAQPNESELLTKIAFHSKAYWGYDNNYMERCRKDLVIHPEELDEYIVNVLEVNQDVVGFYELRGVTPEANLFWLFLDPKAIGQGLGKTLWQHAKQTAKDRGYKYLDIKSDPNAEGFYKGMGAVRVGELPSSAIPGLYLPLLRINL